MRKLILLAILTGIAKMLFEEYRASQLRTPFPTSKRPPEGYSA